MIVVNRAYELGQKAKRKGLTEDANPFRKVNGYARLSWLYGLKGYTKEEVATMPGPLKADPAKNKNEGVSMASKAKWSRVTIPANYQGREETWINEQSDPAEYRRNYEPGIGYVVERRAGGAKFSSKGDSAIGTGNIVSSYVRPGLKELTKEEFEDAKKIPSAKQLTLNMWSLTLEKNPRVRGAYLTTVLLRRMGKYFITVIPTDKNGQVSQINMCERLMDVESGDRSGHIRNVFIDCSADALKVADEKDKAKVYHWFIYPNESDVKYIDDSHTKIVEIMKSGKNGTGRSSRVLITGGTPEQRDRIAKSLSENFTVREKYLINNCLIEIVSNNKDFAGCFSGHADSKGVPIGTPRIQITSRHTDEADVIVHEAIHALREFDVTRDTKLRAVKHYSGKDADLEESLTEAETTGRETPFKRGDNYTAGYYHYVTIPNPDKAPKIEWTQRGDGSWVAESPKHHIYMVKLGPNSMTGKDDWNVRDIHNNKLGNYDKLEDAKDYVAKTVASREPVSKSETEMVVEDRVTITGDRSKSQKGRRVQKSLLLKYPMTNIAHLKLKGAAEAIDTYYEVDNRKPQLKGAGDTGARKQFIHMYNPSGTPATDRAQDKLLDDQTTSKIIQYHDGKPVVVDPGEKDQAGGSAPSMASEPATRSRDPKFRNKPPRNFNQGGKGSGRKPAKTGGANRVGPYYHRGGSLSRRRI